MNHPDTHLVHNCSGCLEENPEARSAAAETILPTLQYIRRNFNIHMKQLITNFIKMTDLKYLTCAVSG